MKIELTDKGLKKVKHFIKNCKVKRKEVLDAGIDTADYTSIPSVNDILCDIEQSMDEDGNYYNCWGVTDNYNSDEPITLLFDTDFIIKED